MILDTAGETQVIDFFSTVFRKAINIPLPFAHQIAGYHFFFFAPRQEEMLMIHGVIFQGKSDQKGPERGIIAYGLPATGFQKTDAAYRRRQLNLTPASSLTVAEGVTHPVILLRQLQRTGLAEKIVLLRQFTGTAAPEIIQLMTQSCTR